MIRNSFIKERITTAVSYINKEDKVADIGCDHGYLGIACIEKGVNFIQNIDNKPFPLASCKKNFAKHLSCDVNTKVLFTLSSGLRELDKDINTVTILGMGGETIIQILNDDIDKARLLDKIIIEANTKIFDVRKYLSDNGFSIIDEEILKEGMKIYEIIVAHYVGSVNLYSFDECLFGPVLMVKKDPLFLKKWTSRKQLIENILGTVDINSNLDNKFTKMYNEYNHIKGMLEGNDDRITRKTIDESKETRS